MRQPRIILDFLRNSDAKLEIQSNSILACMTKNPDFPNPMPTLPELSNVMQQYSVSLAAAQNRDRIHVKQKDKDRSLLEASLKGLSNYVTLMANDDRAIMTGSGFTVSAEATSKSNMEDLKDFNVTVGKAGGEATMSVKPLKAAHFYLHYYAIDAVPRIWMHKASKYATLTLSDLQPLTTYLFQIVAQGIGDEISETVIITKGVL